MSGKDLIGKECIVNAEGAETWRPRIEAGECFVVVEYRSWINDYLCKFPHRRDLHNGGGGGFGGKWYLNRHDFELKEEFNHK